MSKIGRNKKRCDAYRMSGHKELNKLARKERNEKRIAKFAKRRAEGKNYTYKPNPFEKGTSEYRVEAARRAEKNLNKRLPLQKITSIMRKLQIQLDKESAVRKAFKESNSKKTVKTA